MAKNGVSMFSFVKIRVFSTLPQVKLDRYVLTHSRDRKSSAFFYQVKLDRYVLTHSRDRGTTFGIRTIVLLPHVVLDSQKESHQGK